MSAASSRFHAAGALFDALVDLPEHIRTARLEILCDDDGLRAEVESLLRADALADAFDTAAQRQRRELDTAGVALDSGAGRAGPWRVLEEIGRGGMGVVYRVERDADGVRQRGALKVLHASNDSAVVLARFERERRLLARLEHPAIARLLDAGATAQGTPCFVMDYVDGEPIDRYVERHALPLRERLRLFLGVCDAVAYAHRQLVVHRDIKPANVLVTSEGQVKLLDFGIAKLLDDEASGDAVTRADAQPLTPRYAAPEQLRGAAITTATDVYGLGGLLYLLLSGRPPRKAGAPGDDPGDCPPPSTRVAPARAKALRGDLDTIALRALAAAPERRYASVDALAEDVRRHGDGRPILARRNSRGYLAARFVARHRLALGAAGAVLVVSLAAAIGYARQARIAAASAERAEAARAFVVGVFAQASPDENNGRPFTAHELIERGERQLAQSDAQVELVALLAELYWNVGDYERAKTLATRAVDLAQSERVPDIVRARSLLVLGQVEIELRDFAAVAAHAEQARVLALRAGAADEVQRARRVTVAALVAGEDYQRADPQLQALMSDDRARYGATSAALAEDWLLLGKSLDNNGRGDAAIAAVREAIRTLEALPQRSQTGLLDAQNRLGLMLLHRHDLEAAADVLRAAIDLSTRIYGADNVQTWTIRSNLIRCAEIAGRFAEAAAERAALLGVERDILKDSNPAQIASHAKFLAADYRELGRLGDAEALFRESLALSDRAAAGTRGNDSADTLLHLGYTLQLQGRYDAAETAMREALAIASAHEQPTSPWLNDTRGRLGNLLRLEGRHAEALAELRAATDALDTPDIGGSAAAILANLLAQRSLAELDGGDAAQGDATATRARALAQRSFEPGNFRLGLSLYAAGRAKLALGDATSAVALLREALAVRAPPHPPTDLRVLEVEAALVAALAAGGNDAEAAELRRAIEPRLGADGSVYAQALLRQIATR